jgi:hypothetical protein
VTIQLEIAKVFDTVPPKAIKAALERLGFPKGIREVIMNSYASPTTSIGCAGSKTDVPLLRGVKQVDTLSLYLQRNIGPSARTAGTDEGVHDR